MQETIDEWASVLDNILIHQEGYPDPEYLKSICFAGNMDENFLHFTGPLETEGARHIIHVLLGPDPCPVWVQAWGGTNTIAQAISILEKDYRRKDIQRAKSKLKIFAIADQDSTSAWIRENHPEIFYIRSHQFTALNYQHEGHPYSDHVIFSDEWTTCHVKKDHGPLGNMYAQSYFSEGDSPAFFHLIGNGLRADTDPTWGGWGGRFEKNGNTKYYSDAVDAGDRMHGQWIWLLDIQADFAVRMDWCVMDYKSANHYPELPVDLPLEIQARPGDMISLDARGCSDPDSDKLHYKWWHYHHAGKNPVDNPLPVKGADKALAKISIPESIAGKELHIVLEVSDENVLSDRKFRKHFEHYDERIKDWFEKQSSAVYSDLAVDPFNSIWGNVPSSHHRAYNPWTHTLTFRGESFDLAAVIKELKEIRIKCSDFART
jgi:hypothetical protein